MKGLKGVETRGAGAMFLKPAQKMGQQREWGRERREGRGKREKDPINDMQGRIFYKQMQMMQFSLHSKTVIFVCIPPN